ncbi:GP5a [Olivier's shrew virus 1]|uniref:GP5a n=1 Tax=Olivier's shrew virus 1 TaxID=2012619 RepID=A0A1Z2RX61_9NIDO|nr:GP5a [Olivier's shrew virus 1]ASA49507.1 GP5a [Olivier's shrew virus 1]ASA49517.1 GP5a [Olivier's shrew virus 2]AVM86054.1 GP5a [Olivier's shrew virus 3]
MFKQLGEAIDLVVGLAILLYFLMVWWRASRDRWRKQYDLSLAEVLSHS